MLIIVAADNKSFRQTSVESVIAPLIESERIMLDDTLTSLVDLEQYLYPSLFTLSSPIIHVQFLLEGNTDDLHVERIKKFTASPTIFIFEEFNLPSPLLTTLKKHGAVVHTKAKEKAAPKDDNMFAVTKALTLLDKKSRWLAFREAMEKHSIEAVLGILYWKVRELAVKKGSEQEHFKSLYKALLDAHAKAWQTGAPLELLIEKVILTK